MCQPVSVQVLALQRHYSDLVGSIQDPEDIAGTLYSKNVISRTVRDKIQTHLITQRKNEVLINAVEASVMADPQTFYVFADVLRALPYLKGLGSAMADTVGELCRHGNEYLDPQSSVLSIRWYVCMFSEMLPCKHASGLRWL